MADIETYLNDILTAIYGRDVRQSIHDGIQQCYDDMVAGSLGGKFLIDLNKKNGELNAVPYTDSESDLLVGKGIEFYSSLNRALPTLLASILARDDGSGMTLSGTTNGEFKGDLMGSLKYYLTTDWNLEEEGLSFYEGDYGTANAPTTAESYGISAIYNEQGFQIASEDSADGYMYFRTKRNGVWTDWEKIATVAEITSLSNSIDKLAIFYDAHYEEGWNRLNPDLSTFENGFLNPYDGIINDNGLGYKSSDYIDISDSVGRIVVFSYYSAPANAVYPNDIRHCFYDKNKTYISGSVSGASVTVPENAHYLRVSFDLEQVQYINRRMVIVGDTISLPSALIPYNGMVEATAEIKESALPSTVATKLKSKVIIVGEGKDFTTITEAVASITHSEDTEYNIYIDDGTYEEYGITLPDHVNLIGSSGNREKCIIKGELPDTASASEIEQNSTINLMYSNRLENLTITAKNLRYPIHSESGGVQIDWVQILNNCYVEHFGNTSPNSTWTSCHAWGEGASSGAYAEFNNCVFKGTVEAWYVHEPVNMPSNQKPYHHVLNNCDIINTSISTTPYWIISAKIDNTTDKGVISTVDFNNCNFGNGCVSVSGNYDVNVNIHGHNNVTIVRGKTSNYPNTDFTTVKTYVGTESITKNTVLMYADGINLVKKANASTPKHMIAGVSTEDCDPNSLVKIIKGTYVSKTGSVGSKVYCDDNGQFSDSGTVEIGVCYGQFSLIN